MYIRKSKTADIKTIESFHPQVAVIAGRADFGTSKVIVACIDGDIPVGYLYSSLVSSDRPEGVLRIAYATAFYQDRAEATAAGMTLISSLVESNSHRSIVATDTPISFQKRLAKLGFQSVNNNMCIRLADSVTAKFKGIKHSPGVKQGPVTKHTPGFKFNKGLKPYKGSCMNPLEVLAADEKPEAPAEKPEAKKPVPIADKSAAKPEKDKPEVQSKTKSQLEQGTAVEKKEHEDTYNELVERVKNGEGLPTLDEFAESIAKNHIDKENKNYYDPYLKDMEAQMEKDAEGHKEVVDKVDKSHIKEKEQESKKAEEVEEVIEDKGPISQDVLRDKAKKPAVKSEDANEPAKAMAAKKTTHSEADIQSVIEDAVGHGAISKDTPAAEKRRLAIEFLGSLKEEEKKLGKDGLFAISSHEMMPHHQALAKMTPLGFDFATEGEELLPEEQQESDEYDSLLDEPSAVSTPTEPDEDDITRGLSDIKPNAQVDLGLTDAIQPADAPMVDMFEDLPVIETGKTAQPGPGEKDPARYLVDPAIPEVKTVTEVPKDLNGIEAAQSTVTDFTNTQNTERVEQKKDPVHTEKAVPRNAYERKEQEKDELNEGTQMQQFKAKHDKGPHFEQHMQPQSQPTPEIGPSHHGSKKVQG